MKNDKVFNAMEFIDSSIIDEVEAYEPKRKYVWVKWGTAAACLCLIIASTFTLLNITNKNNAVGDRTGGNGTDSSEVIDHNQKGNDTVVPFNPDKSEVAPTNIIWNSISISKLTHTGETRIYSDSIGNKCEVTVQKTEAFDVKELYAGNESIKTSLISGDEVLLFDSSENETRWAQLIMLSPEFLESQKVYSADDVDKDGKPIIILHQGIEDAGVDADGNPYRFLLTIESKSSMTRETFLQIVREIIREF